MGRPLIVIDNIKGREALTVRNVLASYSSFRLLFNLGQYLRSTCSFYTSTTVHAHRNLGGEGNNSRFPYSLYILGSLCGHQKYCSPFAPAHRYVPPHAPYAQGACPAHHLPVRCRPICAARPVICSALHHHRRGAYSSSIPVRAQVRQMADGIL